MYKKILAATDGSSLADHGIIAAASLAKQLNAELYIVTVTNPVPGYNAPASPEWMATPRTIEEYQEEMKKGAKEILVKCQETARQHGVESQIIHAQNELPSHGVADTAKEYNIDLIVIASHGRRGLKRVILGSQAQELLSLSEIPVLVVK